MQRHAVGHFNPTSILAIIREQNVDGKLLTENERKELVDRYLEVKKKGEKQMKNHCISVN